MSLNGKWRQLIWVCCLMWSAASSAAPDHSIWDELLNSHVKELNDGRATQVDYAGIQAERSALTSYLSQLTAVTREEFESWDHLDQLAFLINAYNAWTVELILQQDPGLESIRDIGFLPGAAWRRNFVSLFGDEVSLDDIEHGMIRGWGRYNEPRIHFAVNCAAIGCPALRNEAYQGGRLVEQLEEGTRLFLEDRSRNHKEGSRLYVSRIFDWYEEDFEQGWLSVYSVAEFLQRYANELELTAQDVADLSEKRIRIRYTDYDWGLNQINPN